jgi:hypothetical protein
MGRPEPAKRARGDTQHPSEAAQSPPGVPLREPRPEALLAQLVLAEPDALWYLVVPFADAYVYGRENFSPAKLGALWKDNPVLAHSTAGGLDSLACVRAPPRYVNLRGSHLLVEKLCTGSFFSGQTHGQDDDGGLFQALASGKTSQEACTAAAAVPQLVVVGGRGGALGLDLGASFLASRALAHLPVEQLRDLLAAPDAADRLAAAGVAVSVNLRRCPFDRRAFVL